MACVKRQTKSTSAYTYTISDKPEDKVHASSGIRDDWGVGGVKMGEQPLQLEFVDKIVVLVCLLWLWLSVLLMFVSAGLFELPVQV